MAVPQSGPQASPARGPPALRGGRCPQVHVGCRLPLWRFRQCGGGGSTEGAAPPAPLRALPGASARAQVPHRGWRGWGAAAAEELGLCCSGRRERRTRGQAVRVLYHSNACCFLRKLPGRWGPFVYIEVLFLPTQHTRLPSEHFRCGGWDEDEAPWAQNQATCSQGHTGA